MENKRKQQCEAVIGIDLTANDRVDWFHILRNMFGCNGCPDDDGSCEVFNRVVAAGKSKN